MFRISGLEIETVGEFVYLHWKSPEILLPIGQQFSICCPFVMENVSHYFVANNVIFSHLSYRIRQNSENDFKTVRIKVYRAIPKTYGECPYRLVRITDK